MPDEYEVKWARARMWRTRAPNNYEARERLRVSFDPLDRKALEILEANDAAREATARPQSVIEAERERAEISEGNTEDSSPSVGGERAAIAPPPSPAPRTPAAVFQRQLDSLLRLVGNRGASNA
jgi:hypothetical protein